MELSPLSPVPRQKVAADLVEPVVAQLAGHHFHGESRVFLELEGVELLHKERHLPPGGHGAHHLHVAVGIRPPKMEVAMGDGEWQPRLTEQEGHHRGVGATAHGEQIAVPAGRRDQPLHCLAKPLNHNAASVSRATLK